MPNIQVNDVDMYYEIHGQGFPLLLISGLSFDVSSWIGQVDAFTKSYQVFLIDNRGAGRSRAPDYPYTTAMMAEDCIEFLKTQNITKAHVVGHSLGGAIAQQMALKNSALIDKLVLFATFAEHYSRTEFVLQSMGKLIDSNLDINALIKNMLPWNYSSNFFANPMMVEKIVESIAAYPYLQQPLDFKNQLNACVTHDVAAKLHQIKNKTLVLVGEDDILTPPTVAKVIADNIPDARMQVLPHLCHSANIENPVVFNEAVLNFLR